MCHLTIDEPVVAALITTTLVYTSVKCSTAALMNWNVFVYTNGQRNYPLTRRNLLLFQQVDHVPLVPKQLLPYAIHDVVYELCIDQQFFFMQQMMLNLFGSE
jgi:hypothetical protein